MAKRSLLIDKPEELVYRSCYAPVNLQDMLATAESRSRIRRLPASQLFFGLKELDDEDIAKLMPHVTEEQWTGLLDLDIWSRDRAETGLFLAWQRHMLSAEDAVARKLIRAADIELWQLIYVHELKIFRRLEEGFEGEPAENEEWLQTPDNNYLLVLPDNPDKALLLRNLVLRLYALFPELAAQLLEGALMATATELEENAYQNRRRRIEDLGFQDYFEALSIYTPISSTSNLARKQSVSVAELNLLPSVLTSSDLLLLFRVLARIDQPAEVQGLLEELFFVCNKVLSADRVSAARPSRVKKGIRKAVLGINVGLDCWSQGNLERATEGLKLHYLQSFFQIGYGQLMDLRSFSTQLKAKAELEPGSLLEATVEGLNRRYPVMTFMHRGTVRKRFFRDGRDLKESRKFLESALV